MKILLVLVLLGMLVFSFLSVASLPSAFGTGTQLQAWIDTTVVTNQCGLGTSGLNFTAPTTSRPPAVGNYNFCSQAASNEGVFTPASVQVQLYGAGGTGQSFNMSFYDVTDGNFTVFSFTNVLVNFGSATTCNSPVLMTLTLPGANGKLETSFPVADAVFQARFSFGGPIGTTPPSLCDSPSAPSNILLSSSVLPTPEFPFGAMFAIAVPLLALGSLYLYSKRRGRGIPSL